MTEGFTALSIYIQSCMDTAVFERNPNAFAYPGKIPVDLAIMNPQHLNPKSMKISRPGIIFLCVLLRVVLRSIDLNDQFCIVAEKIRYVGAD